MIALKNNMNNKIPPPIVTLFFGLCIYLSRSYFPVFSGSALNFLSICFSVYGIFLFAAAVISFKKQKTTVNPISIENASSLVVSGIFKQTRNPMYLGMSIMLMGFGLIFGAKLTICLVALFVLYITFFQIMPEERAMHEKFSDWEDYCSKVRRWL